MTTTPSINSTASTPSTSTGSSTNKSAGQNIISSLGMGSGVDVQKLAQNLVDATKAPLADIINKKISRCESRISGYGTINYILSDLKNKCSALDDRSDFNSLSARISQEGVFSASVSGLASQGSHSITVNRLAQGQRSISASGFATADAPLGNSIDVTVTIGSKTLTASASATSSVSDLVATINSRMGSAGIKAQLINRGSAAQPPGQPYYIVLSGPTGANNSFSVSGLDMAPGVLQSAQDALVNVDGVDIQSPSNTLKEAIPGVSLNLTGLSPIAEVNNNEVVRAPVMLSMTRDLEPLKTRIRDLVTSYNDVNTVLNSVSDPKSAVENYGGTLVGDSTVNTLRNQIRNLLFADSKTPGGDIRSLRDLGISVDQTGTMTLDETKMTTVLQERFDDVVQMLSASRETPTQIRAFDSGLTGDAVKKLSDMLLSTATIGAQTRNAQSQITRFREDLDKLNLRMDALLARYNSQFAAMESLLTQTNSLKSSLKSTFDNMLSPGK